ncbi:MAG: excinuclease ABC subunit UvrC [Desulfuromonadaceae bacterium]
MPGLQDINLDQISTRCGVYLMYDDAERVIYVGKARNLRARLRQYIRGDDKRAQIQFLMQRARHLETVITDTEKEALILENTLIKKHKPRYNINLRDDKTYVSLRIDLNEEYPAIKVVRRVKRDKAMYFGPYASAGALKQTLKEIQRIFTLRRHAWSQCRRRERPCLFYQIGQCSAPCHGKISREDYRAQVQGVIKFLSGRQTEVVEDLRRRMHESSAALDFEEAARLRDQINAIEETLQQQKVVSSDGADMDVIGIAPLEGEVELCMLCVRGGRLVSRRTFALRWIVPEAELLLEFLQQYYSRDQVIPPTLLLPVWPESHDVLQQWLEERRGAKVDVKVPQRGERRELVLMAQRNAQEHARERGDRREARAAVLEQLRNSLNLTRMPERIECYDISNTQGEHSVASMVVATNGEADKDEYRHYRIRSVTGADDYASMQEVLQRRLSRGMREDNLPDMILLDGGKGQLSAAEQTIAELGLEHELDLVSIAKSRVKRNVRGHAVERSEERFFRPGRKNPITLRAGSAPLFMLERLRDEAHRFAITHHRRVRHKAGLESALEQIEGIGPKRRVRLLRHFGSVAKIKKATLEELKELEWLPASAATAVYTYFSQDED